MSGHTDRLMVDGLCHEYAAMSDSDFFASIDAHGGWPIGYQFIGFVHGTKREAGFCNSPANDGWWTVVASADDYYLWKLSPEALKRVVDAAIDAARITRVDPQRMLIKNWRGWKAVVSTTGAAP